ncbi:hypothetical protein [endosymbiont GvMRE of Glomus versiforme]|nr:hypothetical protein [endosymbiont GvMRE of Glomus versiforme]RHZ35539.1 hypothetical protein GvMRE_IIg190 [endosymbiont GvMRE of Glomus versiforme]
MVKNNKQINKSYQYPPCHEEIITKMRHPNYDGGGVLLYLLMLVH